MKQYQPQYYSKILSKWVDFSNPYDTTLIEASSIIEAQKAMNKFLVKRFNTHSQLEDSRWREYSYQLVEVEQ